MEQSFEDEINSLLTFMYLCEDDKHKLSVPLKAMDGAVPLLTAGAARSEQRAEFLTPINEGTPAVWPVDAKSVFTFDDSDRPAKDRWPEGSLQFHRVRTITTAEARPYGATKFSPKMVHNSTVVAMPDGRTKSGGGPYCLLAGKWVPAAPKTIEYPPPEGRHIAVALGFALAVRYEWSVWIGHGLGPRIRLLSDPLGAREAFRLRDIPPGRERRAALRNWVSSHWRRKRSLPTGGDDYAWVRKHLRGATDFEWNGLRCRIQPAAFDVEMAERQAQ